MSLRVSREARKEINKSQKILGREISTNFGEQFSLIVRVLSLLLILDICMCKTND